MQIINNNNIMKKIVLFGLISISIFLVASPCNNEFYITNDALGAKINPNISNDSLRQTATQNRADREY